MPSLTKDNGLQTMNAYAHNKLRTLRPNSLPSATPTITCPSCTHSFPLSHEYQNTTSTSSKAAIYTTWNDYNTEEKVKASPYYTKTSLPQHGGHNALLFHAAHPVPIRYLRTLASEQLESLKAQLTNGEDYGVEMRGGVGWGGVYGGCD